VNSFDSVVVYPGWMSGCWPKLLCHSTSWTGQGRKKNDERLVGWGQGEITHQLQSWAKQTQLWEN